jgi:hypothetical protein
MAKKYGVTLYKSEVDEIPCEVRYEDEYQIAGKNQKDDVNIITTPV